MKNCDISRALLYGILYGVGFLTLYCNYSSPSPGENQASVMLSVTPNKVAARTGVATITATGVKSSGAPIWENTELLLFADVGLVDPQIVYFRDGRAEARYYASDQIGSANISATCGRIQIAPITIEVGGGPSSLILSASRTALPQGGGTVALRAVASDDLGNPVPAAPVVFKSSAGTLQSGGRVVATNASGVAKDRLSTDASATVTAESTDHVSSPVEITVEPPDTNIAPVASFVYSPAAPLVGESVFFNGELSTDEDGRVVRWSWDFGDGATGSGKRARHTYAAAGTYTVVLCVTDNDGARACASDTSLTIAEDEASR